MIPLWITIGLVIAATLVSTLGAYFSIIGIGALFSGALVAVCLMAGSLEFAKFVLAAYLHQTWKKLNFALKVYMTFAVITLSVITSIGVFGFLSDAYQSASAVLEGETIKLENIKKQQEMYTAEIERLNYSVEEIPEERIGRRLNARKAIEPRILELNQKIESNEKLITESNLQILEVKKKVGPLIYISRNFNIPIDRVVQYLILIFVSVFDPLAICLVIASTYSIESRKHGHLVQPAQQNSQPITPQVQQPIEAMPIANQVAEKVEAKPEEAVAEKVEAKPEEVVTEKVEAKPEEAVAEKVEAEPEEVVTVSDDVIVQMNFKDETLADKDDKDESKVV